jgi:outer membrane protein
MKKLLFICGLIFLVAGISSAQLKIGYVDSDTIMENLPDAQDARAKLDQLIQDWQSELNTLESEWKTKFDDYDRRKLIMTDATRAEAEQELVKLEQQISEFRERRFGTNGELFQRQDDLMKPIQNRVFKAIQDVANEDDFDFIFDRSGDIMLLFAKDKFDLTARVLDKLRL